MIKRIKKYIINDIKRNYKFYIGLFLIMALFLVRFDYVIYTPGSLENLNDRIIVTPSNESKGSMNLTYVTSIPANIPNMLLSLIIPNWDIESLNNMRVEDESEKEIENRDKIYLKDTSYDAVIAAFKEANMKYEITDVDVTITYIYNIAKTNLKVGDVIKTINGVKITSFNSLINEVNKYEVGEKLIINVLRNNKIIECEATIVLEENKKMIGISLAELKNIKTNPEVKFVFKNNESGSSRGLMCALEIYNRITKYDITKGDIISGTGVIDENGNVGSIGGVKYKLKGAVNKHAKVFIVPSDNYEEAISLRNKYKYDIEIIKADTLKNVIKALKER
ncbi:MAG: PDZ domain-containing protein [Clostridium sp.]|nr:PDZ domain-containing protein [Clostridium sp.]